MAKPPNKPKRLKPVRPKRLETRSVATTWLDSFVAYAAGECHLADNTVDAYRRDLKRFFVWLDGRNIPKLSVRDLADYMTWLHDQRFAPATLARHLVSLKVFFRYLQLEGVLEDNLAELLGSQKLWHRVPQVLSPRQVDQLMTSPRRRDPCWRRDRALMELLYATGCRASELSNLKMRDIHADESYCICHGKGDKQRVVPLGRQAINALDDYLKHERPALAASLVVISRNRSASSPLLISVSVRIGIDLEVIVAVRWVEWMVLVRKVGAGWLVAEPPAMPQTSPGAKGTWYTFLRLRFRLKESELAVNRL